MLDRLSKLATVRNRLQKLASTKEFNAALPVTLKVLEKVRPMYYRLKVGNTTLETKSNKELQEGKQYWAQMGRSTLGSILISKLTPQPLLFEHLSKSSVHFRFEELERLIAGAMQEGSVAADSKRKSVQESLSQLLSEKLSLAQTRADFLLFGNLLLSLQQRVITFPLGYEEEKRGILQMRQKRGCKDTVEFYALMANLGAISGRLIAFAPEEIALYLETPYESTAVLLEASLQDLAWVSEAKISLKDDVKPLYEPREVLLNVKG